MGSEWMVGATHTSCSGSVFDQVLGWAVHHVHVQIRQALFLCVLAVFVHEQVDPASVSTGVSTAAVSLHLNLSKLLLPLAVAAGLMRLL